MVKNDCFPGGRKPRDVDANGILVKNIQACQGLLDATTTLEDKVEPEQNVYANMGIILGGRSQAVLTNNQRPHSNGTERNIAETQQQRHNCQKTNGQNQRPTFLPTGLPKRSRRVGHFGTTAGFVWVHLFMFILWLLAISNTCKFWFTRYFCKYRGD
ncbi:hypothetical protein ACA910_005328 [Epithemia clementina (nom. ined.)]